MKNPGTTFRRVSVSLAVLLLASTHGFPAEGRGGHGQPKGAQPPRVIHLLTGSSLPSGLQDLLASWKTLGTPRDLVVCGSRRNLWLVSPAAGRIARLDSKAEGYDESVVQLVAGGTIDQPTACACGSGADEVVLVGKKAVWTVEGDRVESHVALPFFGKDVADVGGDLWLSVVPALPVGPNNGRPPRIPKQQDLIDAETPMLIRLDSDGGFETLEPFPDTVLSEPEFMSVLAAQYVRSPLIVSGRRRVFTVDPLTFEIKEYSRGGTFKGILREGSSDRRIVEEGPEAVAGTMRGAGLVPGDGQTGLVVKPAVIDACGWEGHILVLETVTDPDGGPVLTVISTDDGRSRTFTFSRRIKPYRIAATRDLIVMWSHDGTFAAIESETLEEALAPSPEDPDSQTF